MNNKSIFLIMLFLCFAFSDKKVIAVADISTEGLTEVQRNILFNKIETELVNIKRYNVTTRKEVEKILKEQKFQQSSGCVNQQCAADIGKMLSADQMLMVSIIFDKDSRYISTTLRLVDVEEAVIVTAITRDEENVRDVTAIFKYISDYIVELYQKDIADVGGVDLNPIIKNLGSVRVVTDPPACLRIA